MSLLVLEPGIESRIVDLGRPRSRSLGVPIGGAADRRSLALGNALVGNLPDAAAMEIALKGPRLRAETNVGAVLLGAPFEAWRGDSRIEIGHSFTLQRGQELHIGGTNDGARAYLCVRGGFEGSTILASRSSLGPIKAGDVLPCAASVVGQRFCPETQWRSKDVQMVAALPGLQADWFADQDLYGHTFTVTPASNRMGLRLTGKPLKVSDREMVSEPVCPGAVQVTPDGQCIVLGVDGQTIGGYPKIAQVIQADLDVLGQLRPGQRLQFCRIAMEDAIHRDRQSLAELQEWTFRLRLSLDAFH